MKCKFCGAEIKEGNNVCEYCGSTAERNVSASQDHKKTAKSVVSMIVKGIIILACIWAVVIVISMIVVLNSDVFKEHYDSYTSTYTTNTTYELPRNEKNLTGQIISCDKKGIAVIEYQYHTYKDVAIRDKELIKWINDTDRKLETVDIYFATDESGDIEEQVLLSSDFYIMAKEEEYYLAVRDDQVISFTSEKPLEQRYYYGGYFAYPDLRLYSVEEADPWSMAYMDPKCADKKSEVCKEYYTGEEITVYMILVREDWYYCSRKLYDSVETGDLLNDYEFYPNQEPKFVVGNAAASN